MSAKKERAVSKEEVEGEICTTSQAKAEAMVTRPPVTFVVNKITCKAEVNKMTEAMVFTIRPLNNKPTIVDFQIDCHLKSLYNGCRIPTKIVDIRDNQYGIQFTPTVRGRHEVTISVNGQQVAGSPFSVFVSILPTQLDKSVELFRGIMGPRDMTVNSAGEVIITEGFDDDVVVVDQHGKRLRSINSSVHVFEGALSVSVDSEDNIYVTDMTNRIVDSNTDCINFKVHEVQQEKGPGHHCVRVIGDEVMLTEYRNEGSIMVYDRELKYVRKIVSANKNTLFSISSDGLQNVYVSSWNSTSIQVFSNDGGFLRSFSCDENGVKMLVRPCGVWVAGQYVYVADVGVDKIVVFTTRGNYVTSFGEGKYYVVCVDQDGFVYAGNYCYNKVDVY